MWQFTPLHPQFNSFYNYNRAEKYEPSGVSSRVNSKAALASIKSDLFLHKLPLSPSVWVSLRLLLPFTSKTSASLAQLKPLLCLWLACSPRHLCISTFQSNYPKWVSLPACCPCQIITVSLDAAAQAIKSNVRCLGREEGSTLLWSPRG